MEYFYKELLKWPEASNEIEEETRKMVQSRHRFWFSFFIIFVAIAAGILFLKAGGFGIFIGILCFLGAYAVASTYYEDELYLKKGITKEKIRVKTVLLQELIIKRHFRYRGVGIDKYFKISYPMGTETVIREIRDEELNYDRDLLGDDLVGLYGKKITIVYYNKEFYVLNHVYPEYDQEEKTKEEIELSKDSNIAVRNIVESIDEKQIIRKKLKEEYAHQYDFKMWKILTILSLFADCILAGIYSMHSSVYMKGWCVVAGGATVLFSMLCMIEWVSCKKHSSRIWSKKKLRKVHEELGSEAPR